MDCLWFVVLFLDPDLSLLKDSLRLSDALEQVVAFLVDDVGFGKPPIFSHGLRIRYIGEFHQVLRQSQGMVKDEPHALLRVVLLGSVD